MNRIRLHVVLHQPEIPQNTGNIGRTCLAVGAKLWLVRPLGFRIDDQALRRAGLDYWQHLEWDVADDWEALSQMLPVENAWYFSKRATQEYTQVRYDEGAVLVFGRETQGLPAPMLAKYQSRALRIPTTTAVRSLNLANAVAVSAYEVIRQIGLGE